MVMTTNKAQNGMKIEMGILGYFCPSGFFKVYQVFSATLGEAMEMVQNGYDKPVKFDHVKDWNKEIVLL